MSETREHSWLVDFLRENWLYIVGPLVVILIGLVLLAIFGDDSPSNFLYNLW